MIDIFVASRPREASLLPENGVFCEMAVLRGEGARRADEGAMIDELRDRVSGGPSPGLRPTSVRL